MPATALAQPANRDATKVRVTVSLPEPLYELIAARARARSVKPESELVAHLERCRDHAAQGRPVWLDDDARDAIEACLGTTISTAEDLVKALAARNTFSVGGITVTLPAEVMLRLETRVMLGETVEDVVRRETAQALEAFCGLR